MMHQGQTVNLGAFANPNEVWLRSAVLARDGKCLVTVPKRLLSPTPRDVAFQFLGQSYRDERQEVRNEVTLMYSQDEVLSSSMLRPQFNQWAIH